MYVEGRELKPYGEPITIKDLRLGITYFHVGFVDEAMRIPVVAPMTYIGKNLEPGDADKYHFQ